MAPGGSAEGLPALGRVYAVKVDFVLDCGSRVDALDSADENAAATPCGRGGARPSRRGKNGYRVAVGNTNHAPCDLVREEEEREQKGEKRRGYFVCPGESDV